VQNITKKATLIFTVFRAITRCLIMTHYKYICILALNNPEDGHISSRNILVVAT